MSDTWMGMGMIFRGTLTNLISAAIVDDLIFGFPTQANCLVITANHSLFAVCQYDDHRIVDISDPYNLSVIITTARSNEAYWATSLGADIVVYPYGGGLRSLDLDIPGTPNILQTFAGGFGAPALKFGAYKDGYIILQDTLVGPNDLFRIVEVPTPSTMSLFDSITPPHTGYGTHMAFDGRYLYAGSGIFDVIDLDDMTNPIQVGTYSGGPTIPGVKSNVIADYVIGNNGTSLIVTDVTDKTTPSTSTTIPGINVQCPPIFIGNVVVVAGVDAGTTDPTIYFYDASTLPTLTPMFSFVHGLGSSIQWLEYDPGTNFVYVAHQTGVATMELTYA